jgi:hypothetical protein
MTRPKFTESREEDPKLWRSVIRVGDGRGFIVKTSRYERYVITAAHCLPHFPPNVGLGVYGEEITYRDLLGPLGDKQPKVWAECHFVDPIADVAVVGSPDCQELFEEAEAYEALTDEASAIRIGKASSGAAWVLTRAGHWSRCMVTGPNWAGRLRITDALEGIEGGMSGSPILDTDGKAISLVSTSCGVGSNSVHSEGVAPTLTDNLPGWLLRLVLGRKRVHPQEQLEEGVL